MRFEPHGIANLSAHLDRAMASAEWFGIPADRSHIELVLGEIERPATTCRLRLLIDPTGAAAVEMVPLPVFSGESVTLAIDSVATRSDDPFCCHKTTWRAHYDEARRRHPAADDVILVNEHDRAVETTIAKPGLSHR